MSAQAKSKTGCRLCGGKAAPAAADYILFGVIGVLCYFLFDHPDIVETARHAYILIRSTLDGDFMGFFENTFSRSYGYLYENAAHYNILMYIIYAVWELPLYLAERIGGFAVDDTVLALWGKAVGCGFYIGCGFLLRLLAQKLELPEKICCWMPLLFWLNPLSFFTTVVMGQYDSICLFFVLWALIFYFDRKYLSFCLIMGVGIVFKFFPVFLLVPLVLLAEKRPLRIIGYGLASLWLFVPTTLLFHGRTGDASAFAYEMGKRCLASVFPGGVMNAPRLAILMMLLCFAAYLYRPPTEKAHRSAALYSCFAAFSLLFLFVEWHPQWLILIVPFLLLTSLGAKNQTAYAWLDAAFYISFLYVTVMARPRALEANLFDQGILRMITGQCYMLAEEPEYIAFYLYKIPFASMLIPAVFFAALFCGLVFKFPLNGQSLGDRLGGTAREAYGMRTLCWITFAGCFVLCWLLPAVFCRLRTFGIV